MDRYQIYGILGWFGGAVLTALRARWRWDFHKGAQDDPHFTVRHAWGSLLWPAVWALFLVRLPVTARGLLVAAAKPTLDMLRDDRAARPPEPEPTAPSKPETF